MGVVMINPVTGSIVKIEGDKKEYTVVKVMKNSVRIKGDDGSERIKPIAFIEHVKSAESDESTENEKLQEKKKTQKNGETKGKRRVGVAGKRKNNDNVKTYDAEDNEDSGRVPETARVQKETKKKSGGVITKKRKHSNTSGQDDVANLLLECNTNKQMLSAVKSKSFKASKYVNKDAVKKLESKIDELSTGLVRMRVGNIMRGALKRMEKESA
jgi:hypothetical protein